MAKSPVIGEVDVQELSIVALGPSGPKVQAVPLSDVYITATITQSIYLASLTVNIVIAESKGLLTRFNQMGVQGQEFVRLKITSPGVEEGMMDLSLWVFNIGEIELSDQGQSTSFVLECVDYTALMNLYGSVNKAYNSEYSKVVQSIYSDHIKNGIGSGAMPWHDLEDVHVHATDGIANLIIPGQNPFQGIDMCGRRAFSKNNISQLFLFYQNKDRHCFHNMETLMSEGANKVLGRTKKRDKLRWSTTEDTYIAQADTKIRRLSDFKFPNQMHLGGTGSNFNTTRQLDIVGKQYKDIAFSYPARFNDFKKVGPDALFDRDFYSLFAEYNYQYLVMKDSTKNNQFYEHVIGHRMSFYNHMHDMQCSVELEGDTSYIPGEIVELDVPEQSGMLENLSERVVNKLGGKWFVTEVTQIFNKNTHMTNLKLIKNAGSKPSGPKGI